MASANDFVFYKKGRVHFFCPLCHYHQSTNTIERFRWQNFAQLAIATLATTFLTFPIFGGKGLFLFFVYWMGFELFYRMRKRQALVCESCGFDPFLYKQDVGRARSALRKHWQTRIETENLFVGKKLKNYKTKPASAPAPEEVLVAAEQNAGSVANSAEPRPN